MLIQLIRPRQKWVFLFTTLVIFMIAAPAAPTLAQTEAAAWQAAKQIQDTLFEAQTALQRGDEVAGRSQLEAAAAIFESNLLPLLQSDTPEITDQIQTQFAAAASAVAQADATALATLRGQIRAELLRVGYQQTIRAIEQNRSDEARAWLLLRVYRPSTRFSRPNADATLAVEGLGRGEILPAEALTAVQADLLDTYQAELNRALDDAVDMAGKDFLIRRAELVGLAGGYWSILQPAYTEQFGPDAAQVVNQDFQTLLTLQDSQQLITKIEAVRETLQHFRAAPLSEAEQARRAGQLLRFLNLVPVEYQRGVRNGEVFLDLELQEATSFFKGAKAAFEDLRLPLEAIDATQTAQIAAQLVNVENQLEAANQRTSVADPAVLADGVQAAVTGLNTLFPASWQQTNSDADFDVIASVLDRMEAAVTAGRYEQAETARLEAYAIFDFGPELRLKGFAPELVAQGDGLFWLGYNGRRGLAEAIADQATRAEIKAIRADLDGVLTQSQRILGDGPGSPLAVIFNAAIIVFREGLEAVVILAALMASLVGAYAAYRRPMILGAILAFAATVITWLIAQQILLALGRYGERLEAVVSLIAIGVLLLITNWFFHKVYWKDWLKNFHSHKKQILSGQAGQFIGLLILGFTSIYREGFETVLFLQALVLDAGSLVVLEGVALGLIAVGIVGWLTFKLQQTLPYKKMLVVTGVLIGGVLLVMVGHTVHVLQAVNWMTLSPLPGISIPYQLGLWFGLYPTWESIIGQIGAAVFVIGSYYLAEHSSRNKRRSQVGLKSEAEMMVEANKPA